MSELRRILIDRSRLKESINNSNLVQINTHESHYLRRVLRLRKDDAILIVDGIGNLWEAQIINSNHIKLKFPFNKPLLSKNCPTPLICLAVVIPKRGFDEILRMTSEIGVDIIQPLKSQRSNFISKNIFNRGVDIIRESVELSERLWQPKLLDIITVDQWLKNKPSNSIISMAVTRNSKLPDINLWLNRSDSSSERVWTLIGPEGGWTNNEISIAEKCNVELVNLGGSILRTSTAAVVAIQSVEAWRRQREI